MEEAEMLMDLKNDYIIKCLSHHTENGGSLLCIVMEFADKGTLDTFIKGEASNSGSHNFKEWAIWRVMSHLSDALNCLHTRRPPIFHRDLKPDNILGQTQSNGMIAW